MWDRPPPDLPIDPARPVNPDHPLNRERRAWWIVVPGTDGGRQIFDLMGFNHGTLTNMTTAGSGWGGTARRGGYGNLLFDGSNDYVALGSRVGPTGGLTVAAWVRPSSTGSAIVIAS